MLTRKAICYFKGKTPPIPSTKALENMVALWPFLKLLARNKMV